MSKKEERKPRKKQIIPKNETPEERFTRVITPRMNKLIKSFEQVKRAIYSKRYEPSSKQVDIIYNYCLAKTEGIITAYKSRTECLPTQEEFSFEA